MGLLFGDEFVIAHRNTYFVGINLGLASVLFGYLILFILGLITFLGTELAPGLIWKVPALILLLVGNAWAISMNPTLTIPLLIIHGMALSAAGIELWFLWRIIVGCAEALLTVPCSATDTTIATLLFLLMIFFFLCALFATWSLLEFMRGFQRRRLLSLQEQTRLDFEEQQDIEDEGF